MPKYRKFAQCAYIDVIWKDVIYGRHSVIYGSYPDIYGSYPDIYGWYLGIYWSYPGIYGKIILMIMSAMSKQINSFSVKDAAVCWFSALTGKLLNVFLAPSASVTFSFNTDNFDILTLFCKCVLTEFLKIHILHWLTTCQM